ncbi:uncharacterized protein LOC122948815 isoform X3 [Acropora millepora]|uniref:uncharacterized protein LOC122948815 isoform X3 n=1 Tax=Acropora millepora TaxID=45264 RepID=UPI001CF3E12D|nr:uncharacterized protein LOC122948815 isoform X3 [Acropora millepora]
MEAVSRSFKKIVKGEEPKAPQGNDENSKGAKGSQALRILKEDKTDGETQPGGPSKENEERKTTGDESGHFDRETQTRGNTEPAAKGSHDQRTPEEGKRSKVTQPGGSSKENQGRKTTDGDRDQLHSGTQTRDDTEPGREEEAEENTDESDQEISIEETDKQEKNLSVLRPRDPRSSRLSTNVLDIPGYVYRTVCIKLNSKDDIFLNDYRMLCEDLGYEATVARSLEQPTTSNPTDELLWNWSEKDADKATVEKLIDLLKEEDLERMDVVEILEGWVQKGPYSRLSTRVIDIPRDIKAEICCKLNIEDSFYRGYRTLAQKLDYTRDDCEGLKQGKADPTDTLIKMWSKRDADKATVEKLIDLLKDEDLKRMDVVEIIEGWVQEGPYSRLSTRVIDIPRHIKGEICRKLNIENIFYRDYRMLAEKLNYGRDYLEGLKQGKADPTDTLIKMWCNKNGPLTVSKLIELLKEKREDVVMILENWVNGLKAC